MPENNSVSGECLCGKIKLRAQLAEKHVDVCHCGMCRTWGGGPLLGVQATSAEQVEMDGEEHVSVYTSSEWAERGFCKHCGTHLFYRLKDGSFYDIPLGLLQQMDGFKLNTQIFIDRKPDFYSFAESTENMTEAEVFAKFAPPE